jgi:hypothetical protein
MKRKEQRSRLHDSQILYVMFLWRMGTQKGKIIELSKLSNPTVDRVIKTYRDTQYDSGIWWQTFYKDVMEWKRMSMIVSCPACFKPYKTYKVMIHSRCLECGHVHELESFIPRRIKMEVIDAK